MKNNSQTRNYAEAMGQAMAFGISVTCCDIFNNPQNRGYIHGVCDGYEGQLDTKTAFTMDSYYFWRDLMYKAESMGHARGHDPCGYGVAIHRMGDVVIMRTVRCHDYLERALDGAESEGTESTVIDMSDLDKSIYLQEHGRVPGTDGQREEGRDGGASSPADGISAGL
jgi:hypothetical protein